jgi:hypothetical protein
VAQVVWAPSKAACGQLRAEGESYTKGLGTAIADAGKPVVLTFAHEFNVSGQYPWAQGECEGTTPAQRRGAISPGPTINHNGNTRLTSSSPRP